MYDIWQQVTSWVTPTHIDHILRITASIVLGGAIGLERERQDKPAGFRTIILICVGACVFTILSQTGGNGVGDPSRIAAQIVTGIGFVGAGAIIHDRGSVVGMTTAASIWAVAAIGMATGFGQFGLAIIGTIVILIALELFHSVERWISRSRHALEYTVSGPKGMDTLDRLSQMLTDARLRVLRRDWYQDQDRLVFQLRASGSAKNHDMFRLLVIQSEDFQIRKA